MNKRRVGNRKQKDRRKKCFVFDDRLDVKINGIIFR
jgi:predicted sulfurtransferase